MAKKAIYGLTKNGDMSQITAMLKTWRISVGKSQGECAAKLGLAGGARTFQRIEAGAVRADADVIERIVAMTNGVVTAHHMHEVRLAWLRSNRPEKFALGSEAAE